MTPIERQLEIRVYSRAAVNSGQDIDCCRTNTHTHTCILHSSLHTT